MAQKLTIVTNDYDGDFGGGKPKEVLYRTEGTFTLEPYTLGPLNYLKLTDTEKTGFRLLSVHFKELILEDN